MAAKFYRRLLAPNLVVLSSLLFVLGLGACSKSNQLTLADDAIILAFGDSLTAGVGTSTENSYPSILSQLSGRTVINAGISGETTASGLQRFPALLEQYQPSLIILLEGGNDILRNQPQSATKANLSRMIALAETEQIPVLLIGVPEKNIFSDSASLYQELNSEFDVMFMEDLVADLLRTRRYKSDPVHLNAEGYEAMAKEINDFLKDHHYF